MPGAEGVGEARALGPDGHQPQITPEYDDTAHGERRAGQHERVLVPGRGRVGEQLTEPGGVRGRRPVGHGQFRAMLQQRLVPIPGPRDELAALQVPYGHVRFGLPVDRTLLQRGDGGPPLPPHFRKPREPARFEEPYVVPARLPPVRPLRTPGKRETGGGDGRRELIVTAGRGHQMKPGSPLALTTRHNSPPPQVNCVGSRGVAKDDEAAAARRVHEGGLRKVGHGPPVPQEFVVRPRLHGVHGEPGGSVEPDGIGPGPAFGVAEVGGGALQQPVDQVPIGAGEFVGIGTSPQLLGHVLIDERNPQRADRQDVRILLREFVKLDLAVTTESGNELRPHGEGHDARLGEREGTQGGGCVGDGDVTDGQPKDAVIRHSARQKLRIGIGHHGHLAPRQPRKRPRDQPLGLVRPPCDPGAPGVDQHHQPLFTQGPECRP